MPRSRARKRPHESAEAEVSVVPSTKAQRLSLALSRTSTSQAAPRPALLDISNKKVDRGHRGGDKAVEDTANIKPTVDTEDIRSKVLTWAQRGVEKENQRGDAFDSLNVAVVPPTTTGNSFRHRRSSSFNKQRTNPKSQAKDADAYEWDELEFGGVGADDEEEFDDEDEGYDSQGEEEEEEEEDYSEEFLGLAPTLSKEVESKSTENIDSNASSTFKAPQSKSTVVLSTTTSMTLSTSSPSSSSSSVITMPAPVNPSPDEVAAALAKWHSSLKPRPFPGPNDYSSSILDHLLASESLLLPPPTYMDSVQGDISFPMRSILLDWLVEVAAEYHLHSQTIFLCVSYVDRFLSHTPIDRRRLQLLGITCMLIASKYWELYPPTIEDFVYISDHTYEKDQVLVMERAVLTCLKFQLTTPTAWEFGRRLYRECGMEGVEGSLMDYLMEAFVQEPAFLQCKPSAVAATACYLALSTVDKRREVQGSAGAKGGEIMALVHQHSGYEYRDIKHCVMAMWGMHERLYTDPTGTVASGSTGYKAVKDKYAVNNKHSVSKIKPRESIAEIR